MQKLKNEIQSFLQGKTEICRSELRQMKYLQNVLSESELLFMPAILITRLSLMT